MRVINLKKNYPKSFSYFFEFFLYFPTLQQISRFRRHGLEKPHNIYQFLTASIFLSDLLFVGFVYLPLFQEFQTYVLTGLYGGFALMTVIFWARASKIDPSDPRIYGEKIPFKGTQINYCTICKSTVELQSKHCAKCDRCTENFDHHCEWLNNCIGSRNYRSFFCATLFMTLLVLLKLMMASYLLITGLIDSSILQIPDNFEEKDPHKFIVFIAVSSVKDPFLLLVLLNLFGFHVWLKIKGISTYQHLMNKRNKAKKVNLTIKKEESSKKNDEKDKKQKETNQSKLELKPKKSAKKNKKHPELEEAKENTTQNQMGNILPKENIALPENFESKQILAENKKNFPEIIPEEAELNFTKESVRLGDKIQMDLMEEVKIKKPFQQLQEPSHRSAEMGLGDEESLNLSGF